MIFMFGYPIKKLIASVLLILSPSTAKFLLLIFICGSLLTSVGFADNDRHINKKSPQEKRAIEQRRKQFKSLPPAEREKVKDRYKWYKDLPPEKQKEIRDRWKKSDR